MAKRQSRWTSLDEEDVFWKGYCEIEETKSTEFSLTDAPQGLLHELWPMLFDPDEGEDEKKFRIYYLLRTWKIAVVSLIVNVVVLSLMSYAPIAAAQANPGLVNQFQSRDAWALYNANWLIISMLCLGFYLLVYLDKNHAVLRLFQSDVVSALEGLGRAVLLGRTMVLLQVLGVFTHHEGTCTEQESLNPADHSFGMILCKFVFDFMEVCALVLIPIPRTYIFRLCLLESVGQSARLLTCKDRLGLGAGYDGFFWTIVAIIVPMYMCIVALPAITLGQTMKASYQHRISLEQAQEEKRALVNMFCTDLKVPVQQTKQLLKEAPKLSQKDSFTLEGGLNAITAVVDHIVFLMRVQEGRFTYFCADLLHMPSMAQEGLRSLIHSTGLGRDDLFDMDIPDIKLYSNKNAVSVLLFYAMHAALIRWQRMKKSPRTARSIGLGVAILPNGSGTNLVCSIYNKTGDHSEGKTVASNGHSYHSKDASNHYQTCLMFCELVATACKGSFEHINGFVRFIIPVEGVQLMQSTDDEDLLLPHHVQLPMIVVKEMAVYSPDPSLSSLAMQALQFIVPRQCRNDVSVFSHLNMADMHVRAVVMVTSLQACLDLRTKRYMGIIVLMSDRLAYLDDKDRKAFDYAVSIPSTSLQMEELARWITDKISLPAAEKALSDDSVSIGGLLSAALWKILAIPCTVLQWIWCPVLPIAAPRLLNYLRWKFLNPSATPFHHTNNIDIIFLFTMFVICLTYLVYPDQHLSSMVGLVPFSVPFIIRRLNVQRVAQNGRSFYWSLWAMGFVLVIGAYVNSYIFASDAVNGHPLSATNSPTAHSGKEFLEHNYGSTSVQSGQRLLIGILVSVAAAKVFAELLLWPYNLWGVLSQSIVPLIVIGRFMSPFLIRAAVIFTIWSLLFITLFIVVILIYTENLRRQEFLQLREFILSKDFLERSIAACWRDTMCPLTMLTSMQESIMMVMADQATEAERSAVSENRTHLNAAVLAKIEKVGLNVMMSKELLYEMQMSLQSTTPRDGAALIAKMDVYLLRPIVRRVASLFMHEGDDVAIKFHLHIHPTLMLVRCDKEMLEAMLCSACRSAVERIITSVKHGRTSGLVHEVLLSLQPGPGQMDLRYSDIHLMHLMVYDTADSPNKHCFMKSLYERYMKAHGQLAYYEVDLLTVDIYRHCLRIALPYTLCAATPKVAAFFPILQQHIEPIVKPYMTFFKQYEAQAAQQIALQVYALQRKHKVQMDMPVPNFDLTVLCHEVMRTRNREWDIVSLDDAMTCGLDRKLVYLRTGVMPSLVLVRNTSCFLVDQQLCIANAVLNRQFLQELILYLRANDFLGIIGLVVAQDEDDDEDSVQYLRGLNDDQIVISTDSWHNDIAGYNKKVLDGMGPEVTFDLGLDAKRLLCLREMCESRLLFLAIPRMLS